ncbi:xylose isomerase-like protein [Amniculicola lignicola CBS 123094]|uniref:Xylose isomerase-like protein n=1 Tax=Amniculicola lignicola CBS 123094 TaxID=1392246 RepID=A0A6A5WM68_9PLEO|nr:xylose isomerase-like protein [Amniculicola lignicola CBS 123094]
MSPNPLPNPLALSTSCLGLHPSHALDDKLKTAARHGFRGIEIVYGDLETFARTQNSSPISAAQSIRMLCNNLNLHILSLCPLENWEGDTSRALEERFRIARDWIVLARILQADYVQMPAQFGTKDVTGDEHTLVRELRALADMAAEDEPSISIAYEPMSWSTYYSTWQSALRLAEMVDRLNFGICLDTFHIATEMCCSPHDSLKLFYIQLSDCALFTPPFSPGHPWYNASEAAEFSWSKNGRPFPLEEELGGYMPVVETVRAWTFDWRMREEGFGVGEGGRRVESCVERLREALALGDKKGGANL